MPHGATPNTSYRPHRTYIGTADFAETIFSIDAVARSWYLSATYRWNLFLSAFHTVWLDPWRIEFSILSHFGPW